MKGEKNREREKKGIQAYLAQQNGKGKENGMTGNGKSKAESGKQKCKGR